MKRLKYGKWGALAPPILIVMFRLFAGPAPGPAYSRYVILAIQLLPFVWSVIAAAIVLTLGPKGRASVWPSNAIEHFWGLWYLSMLVTGYLCYAFPYLGGILVIPHVSLTTPSNAIFVTLVGFVLWCQRRRDGKPIGSALS